LLVRRINGVLTAEKFVMVEYNTSRDKLAECSRITPGKKSPTVCPLEDPNFVAVKAMVARKEVTAKLDLLEAAGATDILITSLENCRV
jgi:ATP phosphoribosyltransferase